MGDVSDIEWLRTYRPDGTYTKGSSWNPFRGCSCVSDGCTNCYAMGVAARFSGPGLAYEGLARRSASGLPLWTGVVRDIPDHLADPVRWRRPRKIFVNSMSDLFHEKLTNEQIASVFGIMAAAPHHTFKALTKRAKRMRDWYRWVERASRECNDGCGMSEAAFCFCIAQRDARPEDADLLSRHKTVERGLRHGWPLENLWLGVSAEDQENFDARVPFLKETPAVVRWVSVEPQLGPIVAGKKDLGQGSDCPECGWMVPVDEDGCCASCGAYAMWYGLDWVVDGGESGNNARPFDFHWALTLLGQCQDAGAAFYMKQAGACPRFASGLRTDRPMRTQMHVVGLRETLAYKFNDGHGGDPAEWPVELPREYPKVTA